jgi:hypothetical protein
MALDKFKAAPLPNPPTQWDPQYMRQVIRVLELYFSQLDSNAANHASKYTANEFVGGTFYGTSLNVADVSTTTLEADSATINNISANRITARYTDTDALHTHRALTDDIMGANFYGGMFYGDGRYVFTPYNQFLSNTTQTAASTSAAYVVTYDSSDYADAISLSSSSHINVKYQGIYQFTFSIQLQSTSTGTEIVNIWFRKNGTDVANSNSQFSLPARKSAGVPSAIIAVTPFMADLQANDYIEIVWQTSATTVTIQQLPAVAAVVGVTPAIPATPSVILDVTFISAQYPTATRVAPLPVFGFGQIGNISVVIR